METEKRGRGRPKKETTKNTMVTARLGPDEELALIGLENKMQLNRPEIIRRAIVYMNTLMQDS